MPRLQFSELTLKLFVLFFLCFKSIAILFSVRIGPISYLQIFFVLAGSTREILKTLPRINFEFFILQNFTFSSNLHFPFFPNLPFVSHFTNSSHQLQFLFFLALLANFLKASSKQSRIFPSFLTSQILHFNLQFLFFLVLLGKFRDQTLFFGPLSFKSSRFKLVSALRQNKVKLKSTGTPNVVLYSITNFKNN